MIHAFGHPDPPVPRLLDALGSRGHQVSPADVRGAPAATPDPPPTATLVLGGDSRLDRLALGVLLGGWRYARGARLLVLSRLGAHPDARAKGLRALWEVEELARSTGMPCVTLRLAPVLGPESPLWRKLRSAPRLPRGGRGLIQPVAENDVVETLDRLFRDAGPWDGWYEVAGREALTLAELEQLARATGPLTKAGEWEPPLEEMAEHRLAEPEPWLKRFGLSIRPIRELAATWNG